MLQRWMETRSRAGASWRNRSSRGRPSAFIFAWSSVGTVRPTAQSKASAISSGLNTLVARA